MFKLWEIFNVFVIEVRDVGLYMKEKEVMDRFFMVIGKGDLVEFVK